MSPRMSTSNVYVAMCMGRAVPATVGRCWAASASVGRFHGWHGVADDEYYVVAVVERDRGLAALLRPFAVPVCLLLALGFHAHRAP